jgi:hypothetical protein
MLMSRGSQNDGGQRCEKKDPERTAALLFHSVSFHARSLVEAAARRTSGRSAALAGEEHRHIAARRRLT